jgi:ATP-dependent Clp protease protease subunit
MKPLHRVALFLFLFTLYALPSHAQIPQPPASTPQIVVINFLVEVRPDTVSQFVQIVSRLQAGGTKKLIILLSSPGGDTGSALAAYNFLKNIPMEITTFNMGTVDSATALIFCGGHNRYALPNSRFLLHSNMSPTNGIPMLNVMDLEARLNLIKSMNQVTAHVLATASNKKENELEQLLREQTILSAEQAKQWGLVQDVRSDFMEPGAIFMSVNAPPVEEKPQTTVPPSVTSSPVRVTTKQ